MGTIEGGADGQGRGSLSPWERLMQRFVAPDVVDERERERARIVAGISLVLGSLSLAYAVLPLPSTLPDRLPISLAFVAVHAVTLALLRGTGRTWLALVWFLGATALGVGVIVGDTGWMASPYLPWFATVPVVSGAVLGARAGMATFLGVVGTLLALAVIERAGALAEIAPHPQDDVVHVSVILATAAIFLAVHRAHDNMSERLHEQAVRAERQRVEAEAASRAKSRFLAVVSHELRTPLTVVLGQLELLEDERDAGRRRGAVGQARTAGRTLLVLLDDLLDSARIDSGQIAFRREVVALDTLVRDVVGLHRERAEAKGLRIEADVLPSARPVVKADPDRLRQVLVNLVSNAVKFTASGRVVVTLDHEDGHTVLAVRDTGPGIPEAQRDRVFQPFEQGAPTTGRKYGGTGLGLHITHQLVSLMGGTLGFDTVEGEGTVFRAALPLETVGSGLVEPTSEVPFPALLPHLRVVVVEDNPVVRQVVRRMLEKLGQAVEDVPSATAALELLEDRPVDLVLMDVQMPTMDGLEATRRLRSRGHDDLPIVALTANVADEDRQACLDAGMDDFVRKPVQLDELGQVLARWESGRVAPDRPAP